MKINRTNKSLTFHLASLYDIFIFNTVFSEILFCICRTFKEHHLVFRADIKC